MFDLIKKYKEVILYLIFGGLTTAVNLVSYFILREICSLGINTSTVIGWFLAVVFAFFTNKIFVFESKSWEAKVFWREFISFILARALTGILEIFGVPLLVRLGLDQEIFGIKAMVAKVAVSVIVIVANYIFSKLFIFKKKQ